MRYHLLFVDMKYYFCATWTLFCLTWNNLLSNINLLLSTQDYSLCNVKLFVLAQNYFSCNTKFLFWRSFRMLCHGDIFLFSRSNEDIIIKKKKKNSFLCDIKTNFVFCASQIFYIFSFYSAYWQHVDLLRSGLRNKETANRQANITIVFCTV